MGIGAFKALTFDGIVSTDYGVYITGEGVYNAPQRAAEVVAIPGRNGAFIQDLGRFDNIQVTYTAGVFGTDQANFAAKIDAFRNVLASRYGYCRLEDEYHQDEYREAAFLGGLEVDPAGRSNAGEFSITFECKPQRFLKTGETAVTLTSGGAIVNPSDFEACPLLLVGGYGTITLGDDVISIGNDPVGEVFLSSSVVGTAYTVSNLVTAIRSQLAPGDTITAVASSVADAWGVQFAAGNYTIEGATATLASGPSGASVDVTYTNRVVIFKITMPTLTLTKGTAASFTATANVAIIYNDGTTTSTTTGTMEATLSYDGDATFTKTLTRFAIPYPFIDQTRRTTIPELTGYSTLSATGTPLYIDLGIGEAYKFDANDNVINCNNAVSLPANLPTLAPGSNVITYDNTITSLDIIPRWWTV